MPVEISKNAQADFKLPSLGKGAFIEDVFASEPVEVEGGKGSIACGLFVQKKDDEPFVYAYSYPEQKVILEGTMTLTLPEEGGKVVKAEKGDVLNIAKGTKVEFTSESEGKAFYVGLRPFKAY